MALGMALVFLFFGFAGEALHARQHQAGTVIGAETLTAQIAPASAAQSCPICEWENALIAGPSAVVLPQLLLAVVLYVYPVRPRLFSVRQILSLRESRGPPCLA